MDSPAGLVALAILVVWLAYFVPSRLLHRQQVSTARTEDRFSAQLRVVAVSGGESVERVPGGDCAPGVQRSERLLTQPNSISAGHPRTRGAYDVERSGISAARREQVSRRQVAARRRAVVTASVATLTVLAVVLGAVTPLPLVVALVPAVLLTSVLVLGRRAAVADARAEAELRHRARVAARATESVRSSARVSGSRLVGRTAPVVKPRVTGRAVVASHAATEALGTASSLAAASRAAGGRAALGGAAAAGRPASIEPGSVSAGGAGAQERPAARVAGTAAGDARKAAARREDVRSETVASLAETVVPRPTYAMKPAAPRWEPAPLSAEIERVGRRLERWDEEDGVVADASVDETGATLAPLEGEALGGTGETVAGEPSRPAAGLGGGLDGILERRRAAGE